MPRLIAIFSAAAISLGAASAPAISGPLDIARDAANLGLHTAKRAVDLGLDTAEGAVDIAKDAVTPDNCTPGERYRDRDGDWHRCQRR
jgi:hypothetical protein